MKKIYYMHKSFGHLVTYQEMMKEMEEWYDGGDPTNACSWTEYYKCLGPLDLSGAFCVPPTSPAPRISSIPRPQQFVNRKMRK